MSAFKTEVDMFIELTSYPGGLNDNNEMCFDQFQNAISSIEEVAKIFCDEFIVIGCRETETPPEHVANNMTLKFSKTFNNQRSSFDDEQLNELYRIMIDEANLNNFYSQVIDLITASNIVFPGVVRAKECKVLLNANDYTKLKFLSSMNIFQFFSSDFSSHQYWKRISTLTVYYWLRKIEKNGYETTSPPGRAVAAFNRLLYSHESEHNHIVWLAMALEALFCQDESRSISSQLHVNPRKIGCALEAKEIKDMYNARSTFLHGSEDIEFYPIMPSMLQLKNTSIVPKEKKLSFDHLLSAFQLLIEALQHMALHGLHELSFSSDASDYLFLLDQMKEAASTITIGAIYFDKNDTNQVKPMLVKDIAIHIKNDEATVIYEEKFDLNLTRAISADRWLNKMRKSNEKYSTSTHRNTC